MPKLVDNSTSCTQEKIRQYIHAQIKHIRPHCFTTEKKTKRLVFKRKKSTYTTYPLAYYYYKYYIYKIITFYGVWIIINSITHVCNLPVPKKTLHMDSISFVG